MRLAAISSATGVAVCAIFHSAVATDPLSCEIGVGECKSCLPNVDEACKCTRKDFEVWTTGGGFYNFDDALTRCAIVLFVGGDWKTCLKDEPEMQAYSDNCIDCFAEVSNCTTRPNDEGGCFAECATTDLKDSQECRACAGEKCEPKFVNCSGWKSSSCSPDLCIEPEVQIIDGLSNKAFFSILGGVLGLVLILAAVIVIRVCRARTDEYDLEEVEGQGSAFQMPVEAFNAKADIYSESPTAYPGTPSSMASAPPPGMTPPPPGLGDMPRGGSFGSMGSFDEDYDYYEKPDI